MNYWLKILIMTISVFEINSLDNSSIYSDSSSDVVLPNYFNTGSITPSLMSDPSFKMPTEVKGIFTGLAGRYEEIMGRPANVFVACTGNTCRSAAVEEILDRTFGGSIFVSSGGTNVREESNPMTPYVEHILSGRYGLSEVDNPTIAHKSRNISNNLAVRSEVEVADLILVMTDAHKKSIMDYFPMDTFPNLPGKIVVLDIKDPFRTLADASRRSISSLQGENYRMIDEALQKTEVAVLGWLALQIGEVSTKKIIENKILTIDKLNSRTRITNRTRINKRNNKYTRYKGIRLTKSLSGGKGITKKTI